MVKTYRNTEEVEKALSVLRLKRSIKVEELKYIKNEFSAEFKPFKFISIGYSLFKKYGFFLLLRKLLK